MKKILVIDDTPEIELLMASILTPAGYEVIGAMDTRIAMEKVRSQRPDLVLLDVMLPGEDGITFCKKLKHTALKDIPVIMVSVMDSKQDIEKGLQAGACDYITKPFDPKVLLSKVKKILGDKD